MAPRHLSCKCSCPVSRRNAPASDRHPTSLLRAKPNPVVPSPHVAALARSGSDSPNTRYYFAPGCPAHRECSSSYSQFLLSVQIPTCTAIFIAFPDLCRRRLRVRSATSLCSPLFVRCCCTSALTTSGAAGSLFSSASPQTPRYRVSSLFTACGSILTRGRHGKQSQTAIAHRLLPPLLAERAVINSRAIACAVPAHDRLTASSLS